ncbi:MAG: aldehyde dehydrogenase family protein [Gammaproteobacteria bacterium]|nr:aldehyde dehydrogenase family protein [Gammaproteobacteria bacterium]
MRKVFEELRLKPRQPGVCSAGRWHRHAAAPAFASANPATGRPLATVTGAGPRDLEAVLDASRQAFLRWREIPAPQRGEAIRRIADGLRTHRDALGTLVSLESGKIRAEGIGEVQEMIDIADFAVGLSRMLYGRTMPSERPGHRLYEQWQPLGVVGIVTAFNFPMAVWSWNAFIAAVCGNACVWKPSPKTPLCSIAVQHICNRALADGGFPPVFSLLNTADADLAGQLVADRRVDLLSFTGSTAVGRQVASVVAGRLGKCLLELGGNNAIIVDREANLDLAVPAILFGAIGTAGQRCTTTRRLIVHHSRTRELRRRLVAAYRQLRIGDPLRKGILMGPLIDAAAVEHYLATLAELRRLGATILHGGRRLKRPGHFVEPALVLAQHDWPPVQRETFAPILYLMSCRSLDQAIAWQNEVPQGLSSALFTDRLQHAERFLAATGSDCGIANVNIGTSGAEIGGAFGGEKDSGGGREAGSDAWKAYMRRQTVTINWGTGLPLAQGIDFSV